MSEHELAGKIAPRDILCNIPELVTAYFTQTPDVRNPEQAVAFGTSGHRGSSLNQSFTESHILAIAQAICEIRQQNGVSGPMFIGMDTHALSEPAQATAIQVLAANGVKIFIHQNKNYTPTPVISYAILNYNKGRKTDLADGVVITPSHNPPTDGGFKYNPTHGGPADSDLTTKIQHRANEIILGGMQGLKIMAYNKALNADTTRHHDFITPYVNDLENVVDMQAISRSGLKMGVDPMGGSGIGFWEPIAEKYKLNLEIVNNFVDPTFSFMHVDKDGKIRMDCSSPYAMAGLVQLKDKFDIAFGNDPDYDRHGIVTPSAGLLNPNAYLAVAIAWLFSKRPRWNEAAAIGKTLVSSSMIDRVAKSLGRKLSEVPVGFKWFVDGLYNGSYGFGGEESAGASFLRFDGSVWTTDKDGIIMNLLAAEITATSGKDPGLHYQELVTQFGNPVYKRIDAPANREQKEKLKNLKASQVTSPSLAGEKITQRLTHAPGNDAAIGGLKVCTANGWFAARPSGTEDIYKIYAESFKGADHLEQILTEAQQIVDQAIG